MECHVRVLNFAPNVVMQNSFCCIEKHLKTQSFISLVFQNPAVIPFQEVFGPLEGIWMTIKFAYLIPYPWMCLFKVTLFFVEFYLGRSCIIKSAIGFDYLLPILKINKSQVYIYIWSISKSRTKNIAAAMTPS